MRIPFRVRVSWVSRVLQDAVRFGREASAPGFMDSTGFLCLQPLLAHGAMESPSTGEGPQRDLAELRRLFQPGTPAGFLRDASRYAGGGRWTWRRRQVLLDSGHLLTARFTPPRASEVPEAMRIALAGIRQASALDASPQAQACLALAAYQLLLTIHPFEDGNGRTMRGMYACRLAAAAPSAAALLALPMLFSGGGARYHEAAWSFRAGDARPLVELYLDALAQADVLLAALQRDVGGGAALLRAAHAALRAGTAGAPVQRTRFAAAR